MRMVMGCLTIMMGGSDNYGRVSVGDMGVDDDLRQLYQGRWQPTMGEQWVRRDCVCGDGDMVLIHI